MRPERLAWLQASRALAEARPLGPALRLLDTPLAAEAAALADQGDLEACLHRLRVPADLVAVARAWPAALPSADARVEALPQALPTTLALFQALSWVGLVAVVQVGALISLSRLERDLALVLGLHPALAVALFTLALCLAGGLALLRCATWGRDPLGRGPLRLARQAAIAAALAESEAPIETRQAVARGFDRLADSAGGPAELGLVVEQALAAASEAAARRATALRVGGLLLLAANALYLTASVYGAIAALGTST